MPFASIQYSYFLKDMHLIVSTRGFNFHLLEEQWLWIIYSRYASHLCITLQTFLLYLLATFFFAAFFNSIGVNVLRTTPTVTLTKCAVLEINLHRTQLYTLHGVNTFLRQHDQSTLVCADVYVKHAVSLPASSVS